MHPYEFSGSLKKSTNGRLHLQSGTRDSHHSFYFQTSKHVIYTMGGILKSLDMLKKGIYEQLINDLIKNELESMSTAPYIIKGFPY